MRGPSLLLLEGMWRWPGILLTASLSSPDGHGADQPVVLPRLALLRAEITLRHPSTANVPLTEAVTELNVACALAEARGAWPLVLRLHLILGQLYQARRQLVEAETEFTMVRGLIAERAAAMPTETLCDHFVTQALALLPRPRPISPRRIEKEKYGGLTERERQVAGFIAQGKSNREIAAALFVGERTIETHVSNILSKLGFDARTQIAAWAAGHGLIQNQE